MMSEKDPLCATIFERYADKETAFLEVHRGSDRFKAFRPALAALEPEIDGHSYYESAGFMAH
jgi:quinol monooxygenase YgiN